MFQENSPVAWHTMLSLTSESIPLPYGPTYLLHLADPYLSPWLS